MNLPLSLLSAVLLVLVFPKWDVAALAPFALAPMLIGLARTPRWRQRFLYGWLAGIVYWFGVCYWIRDVLVMYGGLGPALSWLAILLFSVLKALHMAVFAALAGAVLDKPYAVPAVAALWTGIERTHGPLGFAWLALGNGGADMSVPMRLAPVTGVYGLSFLFVMMSVAIALVLLRRPRIQLLWMAALPAAFLLPALPESDRAAESAVSVQPNIDESRQWTRPEVDALDHRLAILSLQSALAPDAKPPRMILWPEVPAPIYWDTDPLLREQITGLAHATRAHVLFGTVGHTAKSEPLNSAMMIGPDGQPVGRYDKVHLVPFGEFIPPLFGFINRITQEAGDFIPGSRVVVFNLAGHRAGAFICYESVFPHFVRQFAKSGAEVLVNLSNDGYFGRSAAREQHLKIVRMRAAENRRWILRSTNDGITAAIDPAGRVVRLFPSYVERAGRLGFSWESGTTLYTRFGDWFAWGCLIAGLAAVLVTQAPHYRPEELRRRK